VNSEFNAYNPVALASFQYVVEWIREWGVSRSFGLGTRLPFDKNFLIESLSDSTIYFAYYTVKHLLHSDVFGKVEGEL